MPTTPTSQTGVAGEFYVAAQLSQRGWQASVLLGNSRRTDILAHHPETGVSVSIQSKAANGGGDFQAGKASEEPSIPGTREWFAFVGLSSPDERPTFYVVPRNVISAFSWCQHQAWLRSTRRDGQPHRDNNMRNISQRYLDAYRERWDDLLLPPDEIPYQLPQWFWDWKADVGLPPGHPGAVRPGDR